MAFYLVYFISGKQHDLFPHFTVTSELRQPMYVSGLSSPIKLLNMLSGNLIYLFTDVTTAYYVFLFK